MVWPLRTVDLLALSFDEDRIYHVDTFAGEVVRQVDSSVDLVGGASRGRGDILRQSNSSAGGLCARCRVGGGRAGDFRSRGVTDGFGGARAAAFCW